VTSVVVVTKRAGFTLTLQSPNHHFTELRPATGWLHRTWTEDVVVLDLETAGATSQAVVDLRASGHRQPVVVVANDTDGWDGLFLEHPDLHLISLPIAPKSLISTVDRAARVAGVRTDPDPLPQLAAVGASETEQLGAGLDTPSAESLPTARTSVVPPETERALLAAAPAPDEAERSSSPLVSHRPVQPVRAEAIDLVRELLPLVARLSRVPAVAEMARVRVTSVVPCEASAVLLRDGDVWRVAAGDRLRPLEERVQVASTHWLVTEVVGKGHGLLFRDTDVARTKLSGAPLASWPDLLAMPIADVDAVILLARRGKPFGRADLTAARQSLGAAALQLREAVDVRDLARSLSPFLDPVV
jgi:hypothetical protein